MIFRTVILSVSAIVLTANDADTQSNAANGGADKTTPSRTEKSP